MPEQYWQDKTIEMLEELTRSRFAKRFLSQEFLNAVLDEREKLVLNPIKE